MDTITQEQIQIQNMQFRVNDGYLRFSPFKSIGNVLHWLYVYGNLKLADSAIVGDGIVEYQGKPLASFIFDEGLKMPIFTFDLKFDVWGTGLFRKQNLYLKNLQK